jgi:hypothetical protein
MLHVLMQPRSLLLVAINLLPLVGVLFWNWDAFVLLMLYWLETAIVAFWTIVRIAAMSRADLGDLRFQGDSKPPPSLAAAAFITVHAGIFMGVHFLFLWVLFSGAWSKRIHGPTDFVREMVIGTGLWVPLLALFVGHGLVMLFAATKPRLMQWAGVAGPQQAAGPPAGAETLLGSLYLRIFVMQITIILGVWFTILAHSRLALAPVILVKTAVEIALQLFADRFQLSFANAKSAARQSPGAGDKTP